MTADAFDGVRALLTRAVTERASPATVIEVGGVEGPCWSQAFGTLHYASGAPPAHADTVFDLASLTKAIATTTVAMILLEAGRLHLDDTVSRWLPEWRGADRADVTILDLLAHSAGLTAYLPFYRDHTGRAEFQHVISTLPLEYRPGSQSIYSDLGFMLLGFILEDAGQSPLDQQFSITAEQLGLDALVFNPPRQWRSRIAPTELDPWRGRLLVGEVHDENCWALGGVAGHSGLFGAAAPVGRFARAILQTLGGRRTFVGPRTLSRFVAPSTVPGSSRALGWDTMLTTSSCGHKMSASAIGHTGFTGGSLWVDPRLDLYVVLLSNRVHPSRENDAMGHLRPLVHDAVVNAWRPQGGVDGR